MKYYITYSITNEESASAGESYEYGEIGETTSLAEALDWLNSTRTCECGGVRAATGHYADYGKRLCLSIFNGVEFRTGAEEQRSLHTHGVSKASALRIAKLADINIEEF